MEKRREERGGEGRREGRREDGGGRERRRRVVPGRRSWPRVGSDGDGRRPQTADRRPQTADRRLQTADRGQTARSRRRPLWPSSLAVPFGRPLGRPLWPWHQSAPARPDAAVGGGVRCRNGRTTAASEAVEQLRCRQRTANPRRPEPAAGPPSRALSSSA